MTDIASGRAAMLQEEIVKAVRRARHTNIDPATIDHIFGEKLINDPTINDLLKRSRFTIDTDPYQFDVQVIDNLPTNVFYMKSQDGSVEQVELEWDDIKKKNKVTVKKVK